MALNDLYCADVPLSNYSLTASHALLPCPNFWQLKHRSGFGI